MARAVWFKRMRAEMGFRAWHKPVHWKGYALLWAVTLTAIAAIYVGWRWSDESPGVWFAMLAALVGLYIAYERVAAALSGPVENKKTNAFDQ